MLLAGNINIVRFRFFSPYFMQVPVPQGLIPVGMINAFPRITTAIPVEPVDNQAPKIILRPEVLSGDGYERQFGVSCSGH